MTRQGNVALDLLVVGVILFMISIVWIYVSKLNTDVTTPMIVKNLTGTQGTAMLTQQRDNFSTLWDNLGIFMFGLIWVFLIISAYYIRTGTVFFIIMFILMACSFIVIMILGNTFSSLMTDSNFATAAAVFPKLTWLNGHILEVFVVVMITVFIAMYAKNESGVANL